MNASSWKRAALILGLSLTACSGGGGKIETPDNGQAPDSGPPPECVGMADCNDGDPCSVPSCIVGKCSFTPMNCDDGNLCTDDSCLDGQCSNIHKFLCCITVDDCNDDDPCTADACYSYACQYTVPDPSCCTGFKQCDDGNPCTLDDCFQNGCTHQVLTGGDCCGNNLDCHDSNPCTDDACINGTCVWTNAGCCQNDVDCVDDDPCTENGVCNDKNACEFSVLKGCCADDAACDDGNTCTLDVCVGLHCEYSAVGACCTTDGDCAVTDPCKVGECVIPAGGDKGECVITLVSSPECCTTSLLTADFDESGMQEFQVSFLHGDGPNWVVDSKRSVSPPSSLYFGNPDNHLYCWPVSSCDTSEPGVPVGGRITTNDLDLTKTVVPELRFQLWKTTEIVASSDVLTVYVISGTLETPLWSTSQYPQFANTSGSFVPVTVSLVPYADEVVKVAFEFNSMNGFANEYEGVYLDDIIVVGKCQ